MPLKSIHRFIELGTCLVCGSCRINDLGLCPFCESTLWPESDFLYQTDIDGIQVYSLLEWVPGQSDELSRWILSLKSAPHLKWQALAHDFISKILNVGHVQTDTFLIPCPNRDPKRKHASLWTDALSKAGQIEVLNALALPQMKIKSAASQKHLKKQQRQLREFKLIENITLPEQALYVFVDDIVTTGSTAKAAWKALGKPENFHVWCVAVRPDLRSLSLF